ncbi:MAG: PKD domain-containing protein [Gemmatimonadetes bacterium]|nr:PKD domain-containing protein [Gemmatimonadota bacterium]MBT5963791.1 PKD domain-containing protein [Gemmatimonadota bacterium]MBT7456114.1 PKD domain-containing protein [Gemmatimonadota bacterium]
MISAQSGTWRTAREVIKRPLSLCAVLVFQALAFGAANAVEVSLPALELAAGETALVPMTISGVEEGTLILSLNADIRFDASVLPTSSFSADRRSSLTSRWSLAANARLVPDGGAANGQMLLAGATASSEVSGDGTLLFITISVPEDASPGSTSPLQIASLFFNNGDPAVTVVDGSVTIVAPRVKADFTGHPLDGPAPLEVRFENLSSEDADIYAWDFGDGGTSTQQNPRYTYEQAGSFDVSLTVTSATGSDTEIKQQYITATPDQQPPAIVEGPVVTSVTHSSAHVGWVTNEEGSSEVTYCGLRFRPSVGSVDEVVSGLSGELSDEDDDTVAEQLQRGELGHFTTASQLPISCERISVEDLTLSHGVALSGLSPASFYIYRVRSTDASGNSSPWKGGFFVTRSRPDDDPPRIILGPHVTAAPDRALISWTTNEISNSFVQISTNSNFSNDERILIDELVTAHEVWVDVEPGTRYYVRIRSTDASGNSSALKKTRFRTPLIDNDPPSLIGVPIVTRRTATQAVIVWNTQEAATSRTEFGITEDYGSSVEDGRLVHHHQLVLSDLTPRTVYHYRVLSSDASGNEVVSRDLSFITAADDDDDRPRFRLLPYVLKTLHDRVIIGWEGSEEARAVIEFGRDTDFGEIFEVAEPRRDHKHTLTGLSPGSTYHCRVLMTDLSGNGPTRSESFSFRTASIIDNVPPVMVGSPRVIRRSDTSITLEWTTDEISDSRIEYGLSANSLDLQVSDNDLTRRHSLTLTHLQPGTTYYLQVFSTDPDGNEETAPTLTVTTRSDDDRPAVRILSGPDVVARTESSLLVEWLTDRPATSTVEYGSSVNLDQEVALTGHRRHHRVTLTGLAAATTYFLQAASSDDRDDGVVSSRVLAVATSDVADTRPPKLRHIQVERITATSLLLSWRTDEPAGGWVEVGDRDSDYDRDFGDERLKRRHQVLVTGLDASSRYHYRLRASDGSGNRRFSDNRSVRTSADPDERPPRYWRRPVVVASHESATFIWTNDEPCFGGVAVGTESTLGTADEELFETERLGNTHRVTVTGLRAGIRYLFAVLSTDVAGHTSVFGERRPGAARVVRPDADQLAFTTASTEDQTSPVFIAGPTELSRSDSDVLIGWETDEVSDTRVFLVDDDGEELLAEYVPEHDFEHQALITGLEAGTTYHLLAASADPSGNGPSRSPLYTFTTRTDADTQAPRFVAQPTLRSVTDNAATLAWTSDEASTATIRFGDQSLDQTHALTQPGVDAQIQLTDLTPGVTYQAQVEISDGPGNGPARSSLVSFTTSGAADLLAPAITTLPSIGSLTPVSAAVEWSTNEGADGFVVLGTQADNLDRSFGTNEAMTEHRVTVTGLQAATQYFYQVSSVDAWGNGPVTSAVASFTTPATAVTAEQPAGLAASLGAGAVRLAWQTSDDNVGYLVYRSLTNGSFELVAGPIAAGSYTDAGVTAEGLHHYRLTALGADGVESTPSVTVDVNVVLAAGDFDGDGSVGFEDFFLFVGHLGRQAASADFDARFDLDSNGRVDLEDFFVLAGVFGTHYGSGKTAQTRITTLDGLTLHDLTGSGHDATYPVDIGLPVSSTSYALDIRFDHRALHFDGVVDSGTLILPSQQEGQILLAGHGQPTSRLRLAFQSWPGAPLGSVHIARARGLSTDQHSWVAASTPTLRLQPQRVALLANVPNPFNPSTSIRFQLPAAVPVWLTIYDALGQRVATLLDGDEQVAGFHQLSWYGQDDAGRSVASGVYFLVLDADHRHEVGKLLLLR